MTPQQFLRELGVPKRSDLQLGSEEFAAEIRQAGLDPAVVESDGGFSARAMDLCFANDRLARATVSHDFDRLREHMEDLQNCSGFPKKPERIADLGGGPGVIAMFLARRYPQAAVTVYDWSPRALDMGRKWAAKLAIRNMDFRQCSYSALTDEQNIENYDVVLLLHAVPLDLGNEMPPSERPLFWGELCQDGHGSSNGDMQAATRAMARLLKPDGIGIISGSWTEWGAIQCFEALRRTDLSLDWSLSFTKGQVQHNVYTTKKGYAFVRPRVPRLAQSGWEEARAFFACGESDHDNLVFSTGTTESMASLFEDGQELLSFQAGSEAQGTMRVRLRCKAGLLLLEQTMTSGFRQCCLKSLAGICDLLSKADNHLRECYDMDDVHLRTFVVSPALEPLILGYPSLARQCAQREMPLTSSD